SRIEENYSQVQLTPQWYPATKTGVGYSQDRAVLSAEAGEKFTFNFTGTDIRWTGCKDEWSGIGKVTLDGSSIGEIDTYMTPGKCGIEIWSRHGLGAGTHTLVVEVLGK